MLRAYIDDSGSYQITKPFYVLAGFIAPVENWIAFNADWQRVLDVSPRLEYFSMQEANALSGEFSFWSEERRNERVNLLIDVVNTYAHDAVCSIIHHDMYDAVFPEPANRNTFAREMRTLYTRYFLNFYGVFQALVAHPLRDKDGEKTHIYFDEQIIIGAVHETLDAVWNGVPDEVKAEIAWPPNSCDDKKYLPLQSADLIAWKLRKEAQERMAGLPISWQWNALKASMTTHHWTLDDLTYFKRGAVRELEALVQKLNLQPASR